MGLPKVAFYWCASCGGCEEAVLDLEEGLLEVAAQVEVVLWPVAMDFRYHDVTALEDGAITAAFINGAIRTSEQEEIARLLRRKSLLVFALGACAMSGGVPALANLTSRERIFAASYLDSPTVENPERTVPRTGVALNGYTLDLPEFYPTVHRLTDVIDVDYSVPGCAPPPALILEAFAALLEDRLPPKGTVLAPDRSLCGSCSRNDTKPEDIAVDSIRRVTEVEVDPETCFLAQGVVCMGPATRDGCGEACIDGNMPCTGCLGPTDGCRDQGAKMIAALGGILEGEESSEVDHVLEKLVDPAGTFYRYGLSASLLGGARDNGKE
ncbi:MAG: NADH-quinone oxidoreductase subunit B family protein [Planctomycetota bacterium]|jgi:F420-non-reducing hydrogenase small subunit